MANKRWTKKRIKATNWMVGGGSGAYPFSVVDPASKKTMGFCMSKAAAEAIILELKTYGFTEIGE